MKRFITLSLFLLIFVSGCAHFGNKYTEKDVIEKCDFESYESKEGSYKGVDCIVIEGGYPKESCPYKVYYYIFNSKADAQEAFDSDVSDIEGHSDIEEQSENEIRYWEIVPDVGIRSYEYVSHNLLIKTTLNKASCWSDEYNEADWNMTPEIQDRIDLIKNEF